MRLLLVNTLYAPNIFGGAERSVQVLAEALVQRGHEVTAVSLNPGRALQQDMVNGVKVYYLPTKNLYWPYDKSRKQSLKPLWHAFDSYNPWMARAFGSILDRECPDLVHTNNIEGFSVAIWRTVKARHLPLVHTLRGHYVLCPRADMFRHGRICRTPCFDCRLYSLPRRALAHLPDAIAANSRYILERHLELGPFRRTAIRRVIYNAYDPPPGQGLAPLPASTPLTVGYLGRLEPVKGIELLLQAIHNLAPSVRLLVAGNGESSYVEALKCRFPSDNSVNVEYLGFVKPEAFFARINLLVVPSLLNDVLPRTVFEAYAHGVPVVGSERGGIPEIIDESKTGFVFDPDIPESLEQAIGRFVEQPALARRMRPNVLEKAKEFSSENTVNRYVQIYGEARRRDKHQDKSQP